MKVAIWWCRRAHTHLHVLRFLVTKAGQFYRAPIKIGCVLPICFTDWNGKKCVENMRAKGCQVRVKVSHCFWRKRVQGYFPLLVEGLAWMSELFCLIYTRALWGIALMHNPFNCSNIVDTSQARSAFLSFYFKACFEGWCSFLDGALPCVLAACP